MPSSTSGFTATSAAKMNGLPFSNCTTEILGCETISNLLSSAAVAYASGMKAFAAS